MSTCTYRFKDASGKEVVITGQAEMKAFLADGGIEQLLPGKVLPWKDGNSGVSDSEKNEQLKTWSRTSSAPWEFLLNPGEQWDALPEIERYRLVQGQSNRETAGRLGYKQWSGLGESDKEAAIRAMGSKPLLVRALVSGVVSPSEYPSEEAAKSFNHVSHSPEIGAYVARNEFIEAVQREYEEAFTVAETKAQKDELRAAIEDFKAGYLRHDKAVMGARASAYSAKVAGGSKLDSKQVSRRNSTLDRAAGSLSEWLSGARGAVKDAVLAARNADQLAAEKQAKDDKAAKKREQEEALIAKIMDFKPGDDVKFGTYMIARVTNGRDGYPSSVTVNATDLTDNKFDLARTLFGGDKGKLRAVVDAVRAKQSPAETSEKPFDLSDIYALQSSLRDGSATIEQYQSAWKAFKQSQDAINTELTKKTKPQLLDMVGPMLAYRMKSDNKPEIIKAVLEAARNVFELNREYGPQGYFMGEHKQYQAAKEKAFSELVEGTTKEDLKAYADKVAADNAERQAKREKVMQAIADPKTLEDFRAFMRAAVSEGKTEAEARQSLNPEQRARFDELAADDSRSRRTSMPVPAISAASVTTGGDIVATKHTKTGEDLYVVRPSERVERDQYNIWNATAKRMGGWYSSFRGNGAVPGFQFKTRESADAFLSYLGGDTDGAKQVAQERRDAFADDRSQSAVERLNEMADRLEERADESLSRDRKTNTARRASFAASAESAANADKAMARTMRNIANAIKDRKAKFLDKVRQKVQVEMLASFVRDAKYAELTKRYPSYSDFERNRYEKPTAETADYAVFPKYTANRSDLARMGREMELIDGAKQMGQRILKAADDATDEYLKFVKENLHKVSTFTTSDGKPAVYSSKDDAERAIVRSGYRGKAMVFAVKRGQNIVVMGPSMAQERGLWKADSDKRITLTDESGEELTAKAEALNKSRDKVYLPYQFSTTRERRAKLKEMGIESAAEFRAALREFIALSEAPEQPSKVKELERSMVGRKNDGLDFFPTPASIAQQMIEAADITEGMRVLEPSAGMGHIAEQIREAGVDPDVMEFSSSRRELLEAKGFNVVANDFMDASGEYDRIIMNPPFSDRRDAQHVRHAYSLLKPGGRLVAIMGEGIFFGQDKKATEFREWLDSVGGTSEKLPDGSFLDPSLPVNTGVNARMVVVDKTDGAQEATAVLRTDYPNTKAFREWFGSSKMTNKAGDPLLFMHGSPASFEAFDTDKLGTSSSHTSSGLGHFFTRDKATAEKYADGGNIYTGWLKIEKPYVMMIEEAQAFDDAQDSAKRRKELQKMGYDGVVILDDDGKPWATVAFEPWQFKSTDNNGAFDEFDDRMRFRNEEQAMRDTSTMRYTGDVPRKDAEDFIRKFVAEYPGAPSIMLVDSFDQLPKDIQKDALAQGSGPTRAKGAMKNGATYVVLNNHHSMADLQATIFHEIKGHAGIRKLLGPKFSQELNKLFVGLGGYTGLERIMTERGLGVQFHGYFDAIHQAKERDPDTWTDALATSILTEEVFAHIAEQDGNKTLMDRFKRIVGMVRDWLRRHGFAELADLGETDILFMLQKAGDGMRQGSGVVREGSHVGEKEIVDAEGRPIAKESSPDYDALKTISGRLGLREREAPTVFATDAESGYRSGMDDENNVAGKQAPTQAGDVETGGATYDLPVGYEIRSAGGRYYVFDSTKPKRDFPEGMRLDSTVADTKDKARALFLKQIKAREEDARKKKEKQLSVTNWSLPLKGFLKFGSSAAEDYIDSVVSLQRNAGYFMGFHASSSPSISVVEESNRSGSYDFGGIFAAGETVFTFGYGNSSAKSKDAVYYEVRVPAEKFASSQDIEGSHRLEEFAKKYVFDRVELSHSDAKAVLQSIASDSDRNLGDKLRERLDNAFGGDGMFSWEIQKIRGKIAAADGFLAVETDDEVGAVLFLPGAEIRHSKVQTNAGLKKIKAAAENEPSASASSDAPTVFRTVTPEQLNAYAQPRGTVAREAFNNVVSAFKQPSAKVFGALHKTIATQLHKAWVSKDYAKVFGLADAYERDISRFSADPATVAPNLLPSFDSLAAAAGRMIHGNKNAKIMDGVAEAIFAGTLAGEDVTSGRVWTDAELRNQFGLNEQQVGLYKESRAAIDASLDAASSGIAWQMVKNYIPTLKESVRAETGNAETIIDGAMRELEEELREIARFQQTAEREGAIPEGTAAKTIKKAKDVAEARAAAEGIFLRADALKTAGYAPLMRFGKYAVDVVETLPDGTQERLGFYKFETEIEAKFAADALKKKHPKADVSRSVMSEEAWKLYRGVDPELVSLFADKIDGLEGLDVQNEVLQEWYRSAVNDRSAFKRMIQRKGVEGFERDITRVVASFITSNARVAARQFNMGDISKEIADMQARKVSGDVVDEAVKLKDYMENPTEPFQGLKGWMFAWFLGGSVASAALNMTQPLMMTLPYLSQFGGRKAAASLAGATKEAMSGNVSDPELKRALARAAKDGKVDPQQVHHLYHEGMSSFLSKLPLGAGARERAQGFMTLWGYMFGAVENFNRRITFIAAYRMAKNDQSLGNPYDFAVKAIDETQGIYNKANRPNWARGTGPFGAIGVAAFTFKQYSIGYIELLVRMAKSGRNGKLGAAAMLGLLVMLSGFQGFPGADDMEDIIDTVSQHMGYTGNSKLAIRNKLREVLGEEAGNVAMNGVLSLLPFDIGSRVGLGNLLPASAIAKPSEQNRGAQLAELFGPPLSMANQVIDASLAVESGGGAMSVAKVMAPVAFKNLMAAYDMADSGVYRDTRGRKVTDVSLADAMFKAGGFQPMSVSKEQKGARLVEMTGQRIRMVKAAINGMKARAIVENDNDLRQRAEAMRLDWNRKNPEAVIMPDAPSVMRRVKEMNTERRARLMKSLPKEYRRVAEGEMN